MAAVAAGAPLKRTEVMTATMPDIPAALLEKEVEIRATEMRLEEEERRVREELEMLKAEEESLKEKGEALKRAAAQEEEEATWRSRGSEHTQKGGNKNPPPTSIASSLNQVNTEQQMAQIFFRAEAAQRQAMAVQEAVLERVHQLEEALLHPLQATRLGGPMEAFRSRQLQISTTHKERERSQQQQQQANLEEQWAKQEGWHGRQEFVRRNEPERPFGGNWGSTPPLPTTTSATIPSYNHNRVSESTSSAVNRGGGGGGVGGVMDAVNSAYLVRSKGRTPSNSDAFVSQVNLRLESIDAAEKEILLLLKEGRDQVYQQVGKVAIALDDKLGELLDRVNDFYGGKLEELARQREMLVDKLERAQMQTLSDEEMRMDPHLPNRVKSTLWKLESSAAVGSTAGKRIITIENGDALSVNIRRRLRIGCEPNPSLRIVETLSEIAESVAAARVGEEEEKSIDAKEVAALLSKALELVQSGETNLSKSELREQMVNALSVAAKEEEVSAAVVDEVGGGELNTNDNVETEVEGVPFELDPSLQAQFDPADDDAVMRNTQRKNVTFTV